MLRSTIQRSTSAPRSGPTSTPVAPTATPAKVSRADVSRSVTSCASIVRPGAPRSTMHTTGAPLGVAAGHDERVGQGAGQHAGLGAVEREAVRRPGWRRWRGGRARGWPARPARRSGSPRRRRRARPSGPSARRRRTWRSAAAPNTVDGRDRAPGRPSGPPAPAPRTARAARSRCRRPRSGRPMPRRLASPSGLPGGAGRTGPRPRRRSRSTGSVTLSSRMRRASAPSSCCSSVKLKSIVVLPRTAALGASRGRPCG